MCPRTVALDRDPGSAPEWHQRMPLERFMKLLDEFPELQSLSLHGIGEPLMHPGIFDMIDAAVRRGVMVRFTTNATLLDHTRSTGVPGRAPPSRRGLPQNLLRPTATRSSRPRARNTRAITIVATVLL